MQILDGRQVAAFHREQIVRRLDDLHKRDIQPELAIILIGDDRPSGMYAKSMQKVAHSVGLSAKIYYKETAAQEDELIDMLEDFNEQKHIWGILPMMPLPRRLDTHRIVNCMDPEKDIDGLTDSNIARLVTGRPGFVPCTPKAVMAIFDYYHISLTGKEVAIIGRSNVVGKPLAQLCLNRNATVTQCHTRTKNLPLLSRRADIVIAAAGKAGLVTAHMVKSGAVVIDVGINRVDGITIGDVDYEGMTEVAGAMTPVPGGVGAVTTMMVLENVVCGHTQGT